MSQPTPFRSDPPGQWRRVHPLTPFIRSGLVLLAVVGGLLTFASNTLVDLFSGGEAGEAALLELLFSLALWPLILAGLALLGLGLLALGSWLLWRSMGYRVDADSVSLRKGLLNRSHRTARLDRVQSIDISQPLLARLFSMASLTFDVAGGDDSDVTIEFLSKAQAQRLRDQLLARVRELRAGDTPVPAPGADAIAAPGAPAREGIPDAPEPGAEAPSAAAGAPAPRRGSPEHSGIRALRAAAGSGVEDLTASFNELLRSYQSTRALGADGRLLHVPTGRVLGATLWRGGTVIGAIVALALIPAAFFIGPVVIPVAVSLLAGLFAAWGRFTELANFSVQLTPDGVLVRRGLTSTRRTIVPLERIQAIGIRQPLLWRVTGWWEVRFNIAGAKASEVSGPSSVILPVGSREDVLAVLALALPDPGTPEGAGLVDAALAGSGADGWFDPVPARARWLAPVQRPRMGVAITRTVLVWREGRLCRSSVWVPHPRVQSMRFSQGPLARALGLAEVHLHSTTGPLRPVARCLDADAAARLFAEHAERTRIARKELDR